MSSEEDFTDEELTEDPPGHSNLVPLTATGNIDSIKNVVHSSGVECSSTETQSSNLLIPDSKSGVENIPSASTLANSAVPSSIASSANPKFAFPMGVPGTSVPSTSTGNDAYMRFLAERKYDNFSSDEFSSDQCSDNSLDGFEDPNDNSKVKRDLEVLQAYLSQEDSSCEEINSDEDVSIIGTIPHLASPFVNLPDDKVPSTADKINESLKQNKACIEKLDKAKEAIEKRLVEIRERFTVVTNEISSAVKVKKTDGWMLNLCFTSPYFRDERGFPPPHNADYEKKLAGKEVIEKRFLRDLPWFTRDSQFICNEVRKWEIEGILMKREQERKALRRKIAQCEDEEEKVVMQEQLDADEEFNTDNMTLELVVGSRKDGHPDWLAMSVNKLGVERSPETIQAIWENFLDPRLPKGGWTEDEDFRLREIAEDHNEEDWTTIAEKLGTGRTGFMCFMRYKAAVDRDFIGTRFNPQEDGFVRRSVAATTFNHQVSWNQTEFLYRGRRDKRSLKMRWNRLEADANTNLRKGKFTEDEDLAILRAAHEIGTLDFTAIARAAFGNERTGAQVQMRYRRLTTDTKRGQWTLDEDILLVRLVSQLGRNWGKVQEAFGDHRTKEQLRFRHESVAKHVSERLNATHQTLDQVLAEMAANLRVNTRVQNSMALNLLYKTRINDLSKEELQKRRESMVRKRRTYYVRKKASSELDDEYLQFFSVCYNPPEQHAQPQIPPTSREVANAFSSLLLWFGVDIPLPKEDMLGSLNNDPVLIPVLAYLRSNNADTTASSSAGHEQISTTNINSSNMSNTVTNPLLLEPSLRSDLSSKRQTVVKAGGCKTYSRKSSNNSNAGQAVLSSANQGLNNSSSIQGSSQSSTQSTSSSKEASSNNDPRDPLAFDPHTKDVDDNRLARSNVAAATCERAAPMVSIPSLEVMKESAQKVKRMTVMEAADHSMCASGSGALRKSPRGLRIVPFNQMSAAFYNADNTEGANAQRAGIMEKQKTAGGAKTMVKNNQLVPAVDKTGEKRQSVSKAIGNKEIVAKTIENLDEIAVANGNIGKSIRSYRKQSKKTPTVSNSSETAISIDLEAPTTTEVLKANVVPLSSLFPLAPDVTPLQSKAAAKAFADKIEIVSNGKRIMLTKVAAPPPGVKVVTKLELPAELTGITDQPEAAASSNESTPQEPPSKRLKTGKNQGELREINPWTGLPVIAPSSFKLRGEKCYTRRRIAISSEKVDLTMPVLPPGLISMIGIRTFIASMNSLPPPFLVPQPQEDGEVPPTTVESRRAARLWETRILSLFSFPALLARNPLLRRPKTAAPTIVDMERLYPPVGSTRVARGRRSYTRKRPKDN